MAVRYSIQQLLLEIGLVLRDSHQLVTTLQGMPDQAIIGKLAFGKDNRYIDSELFVWDMPSDGIASRNPFFVKSSAGNGTLTLTEPVGPTALPVGARVVLQNIGGKGKPHVLKEQALRFALLSLDAMLHTKVTIAGLDIDQESYWQSIPAGLDSIYKVVLTDSDFPLEQWEVSASTWREIDMTGNRLYVPYDLSSGTRMVEIYGRASLDWQTLMEANYQYFIDIDPVRVVKDAVQWLLMFDRDDRANQLAANLFNEKLRTRRRVPYPDEVFLERPVVQPAP